MRGFLILPGQYYDAESKLWYNRNRYYDASIGRYIQSDPIGLAGGINAYASNNPISLVDSLGWAEDTITQRILSLAARGDQRSLTNLAESGALNPQQQIIADAAIKRFEMTAEQIITKELKGSVREVFPGQLKNKTLAEILNGAKEGDKACQTARKLLTDNRFKK